MHDGYQPPRVVRANDPAATTALLELAGELDVAVSDDLKRAVDDIIVSAVVSATRHAIIDATAVTFMESITLGHLMRLGRELGKQGGAVFVVGPPPQIRRVLELMGLTGALVIVDDHEQAAARAALKHASGQPPQTAT